MTSIETKEAGKHLLPKLPKLVFQSHIEIFSLLSSSEGISEMDNNGYERESIFKKQDVEQNKIFDLNLEKDSSHQQAIQSSPTGEKTSTRFDYIVFDILGKQLDIARRQIEAFKNLNVTLKQLLSKLESQNNFDKRISGLEAEIERMKKVQEMHAREIGHMSLDWFKGGKKSWWRCIFRS